MLILTSEGGCLCGGGRLALRPLPGLPQHTRHLHEKRQIVVAVVTTAGMMLQQLEREQSIVLMYLTFIAPLLLKI